MIEPLDDRNPPMTPQLALRVAIVGSLALAMFALIFFRLWFLQVLTGNQYTAQAHGNSTATVPIPAPRGDILSSNGSVLVDSETVSAVQIRPSVLPVAVTLSTIQQKRVTMPAADAPVFNEVARLLKMSTQPTGCTYNIYPGPVTYTPTLSPVACLVAKSVANAPFANVTIKTGVSPDIAAYIDERQTQPQFRGVTATYVYLRNYPQGKLAAQVLGTVGQVQSTEVNKGVFKGQTGTDIAGQTGLEYEYNQWLKGVDGVERVNVNAAGEFEGYGTETKPKSGDDVQLSLDLNLEKVGLKALQKAINSNSPANSGAFVALDPYDGRVYAMGSLPSFEPSRFTHPLTQKEVDALDAKSANQPLINRAISSPLPDGSTFKPITATAALESGKWSLDETYDDTGQFSFDPNEPCTVPGNCLHNSGHGAAGTVNLVQALQISDDVFFYNLGYLLNSPKLKGGWLQYWARKYGIGQLTGVDLPAEASGTLPTPALPPELYKEEIECETATGIYSYTGPGGLVSATKKPGYVRSHKVPGGCGISNAADKSWTVGDNVNTAVGQGYDQVTPIQLAVVYAALANGGTIVTPHIAQDIENSTGTDVLQKIDPPAKRNIGINPTYLDAILTGLHEAAQSPGGTSYDVMGNFPETVYGKTGTAQEGTAAQIADNTETDYAWYACFVKDTKRPIVIVVSVEKGGFGDVAAAPVARQMLSQWFTGKPGPFVTGTASNVNST